MLIFDGSSPPSTGLNYLIQAKEMYNCHISLLNRQQVWRNEKMRLGQSNPAHWPKIVSRRKIALIIKWHNKTSPTFGSHRTISSVMKSHDSQLQQLVSSLAVKTQPSQLWWVWLAAAPQPETLPTENYYFWISWFQAVHLLHWHCCGSLKIPSIHCILLLHLWQLTILFVSIMITKVTCSHHRPWEYNVRVHQQIYMRGAISDN